MPDGAHRLASIRLRLALWYAGVLAFFLVAFAVGGYQFLRYTTAQRIDEYLSGTANAFAGALRTERAEGRAVSLDASEVVREFRFRDLGVVVYDERQQMVIAASAPPPDPADAAAARAVTRFLARLARDRTAEREGAWTTLPGVDADVRAYALPVQLGAQRLVVVVSQSLAAQGRTLRETRLAILLAIPFALALATAGGWLLARKSLEPVVRMSAQAARIGATNLHERLPVANEGDELGRLALVFNDLLSRLDASFDRQRQFMADASHELRTPVSIVRGEAELALARADRSPDEYREALGVVRDEAARLAGIVDGLFLLARADAGEQPLVRRALDLGELAGHCVRAARSLAERQGVALRFAAGPEVPVRGDDALLGRLVLNLLDNAIKYTPAGGTVELAVAARDGRARLSVTDSGPGIPADAQPRLFDRFFRAPAPVPAAHPPSGAGLGLAIAEWVARAHGGTLALARSDATGSEFVLELPLNAER